MVLAYLTRDFHPLRFSQVTLFACDGSQPRRGCFNARTETGQAYHYPDMRVVAASPPRLAVRLAAALPIPHSGIMASSLPHGFPSRAAYQTYPVDPFNLKGENCRKCVSI